VNLRIPDNIRAAIGKWYLDSAEKLTKFGCGTIRELRRIREHNRKQAEEVYQNTRLPHGVELNYLSFRLVEIFHLEEFDELQRGLIHLFPSLERDVFERRFSEYFRSHADSINEGIWHWPMFGYIYRDQKQRLIGPTNWRGMPELPAEIHYVTLSLLRLLPSMFVVSIDAHLTEEASRRLRQLNDRKYLPMVLFRNLLPWRLRQGHTGNYPEIEMRRQTLGWLEELRGRVEVCLRPFLTGYFTRNGKQGARLPAIEVFALKGVPEEKEAFGTWIRDSRHWCDSFGLDPTLGAYGDERLLVVFPSGDDWYGRSTYRLVARWAPYLRSVNTNLYEDEETAVRYSTLDTLDALLPRVAITEFVNSIQGNIQTLRKISFRNMRNRKRLSAYIKVNAAIQRQSMLLERSTMEFEQQKKLFKRQMEDLSGLKDVSLLSAARDSGDLAADTFQFIDYRVRILKEQLSHVSGSFSDFLALQNMRTANRLQRYVFLLSIIAAIAAIVGAIAAIVSAVATWPTTKQLLHDIFG
jgi:hypothetical protein